MTNNTPHSSPAHLTGAAERLAILYSDGSAGITPHQSTLDHAMATALKNAPDNPLACNILELARCALERDIKTHQEKNQDFTANAKLARRTAKKFARKNGENTLSAIFRNKASSFEGKANLAAELAKFDQQCLSMLDDYTFTPDVPAEPRFYGLDLAEGSSRSFFSFR